MDEPEWILRESVLIAHELQLHEHGGQAGIRDEGLLDSALSRPRHQWTYGSPPPDVASLGAAYAFGIARNHPFFDGNKRTAAVVCEAFLMTLGKRLVATDDDWYEAMMALAAGELSEDAFAKWLRDHLSTGD
ncbi:MAG: type II toxin-antitoxin system death-on-curing family toxin [Planctomycetota bacterium]